MRKIVFELCADSIDACLVAREGGANRIELCSALSEGGLTPSHGLIREVVARSGLPVHVMLRPRGGEFVYSDDEFAVMRADLLHIRESAASGVVFGILHGDGTVDVERTRELVELAGPLEATFHRAFDEAPSLEQALEDVIGTGCQRVLTSGGEHDVMRGAESLSRLVQQAAGRIEIAVGGGLRLRNAADLVRITGARHFHGSLRRIAPQDEPMKVKVKDFHALPRFVVYSSDVRTMIETLRNA